MRAFEYSQCLRGNVAVSPAFCPATRISRTSAGHDRRSGFPGEVSITKSGHDRWRPTDVTDETGSYRFTLLPPGTYRVSFALPVSKP